jgi:hypothetical protein
MDGGGREKARLIRPGFYCDCDEAAALSDAAFDQTIGTTFGNTAFEQAIGTTFGNAAFDQTIGTTFGNTAFKQTISATFGNATFEQTIGTALGNTTFNQLVRAAFSDLGVCRSGGKSVNGENRESDAEKGLAFHDRVLQGVVVCLEPMLRRGLFMRTSLT